jgi:hypothetical protein
MEPIALCSLMRLVLHELGDRRASSRSASTLTRIAFALERLVPALELAVRQDSFFEARTWVIPVTRMNSLKSFAMNCGPFSEMIHGRASGYSRGRAAQCIRRRARSWSRCRIKASGFCSRYDDDGYASTFDDSSMDNQDFGEVTFRLRQNTGMIRRE